MIPKIIHYCWFGRNPLPESAIKCIESWKKFLPDYEIWAWVEASPQTIREEKDFYADKIMPFDVNIIPYTKEAYEAKKYAFVSDYARFWILCRYGGLYFDTDVEVIKQMDDIVARGPFMGIEVDSPNSSVAPLVAPGLGLGATVGMPIYKNIIDYYEPIHFLTPEGKLNEVTVVRHTTKILIEGGLKNINELQETQGIWIYPRDYFNPLNDNTGVLNITDNTRSIHWYTKSWEKRRNPIVAWTTRRIHRYFGVNSLSWLRKIIKY